jgi:hypothetical protein
MPRGRRRKRGSSTSGSSRQSSASTSRQAKLKSASLLPDKPRRRSARISALTAHDEESERQLDTVTQPQSSRRASNDSKMRSPSPRGSTFSGFARLQGTSSKSPFEPLPENCQTSLSPVDEGDQRSERYKMNIILQPPPEVRTSARIEPFPVISLGPCSPKSSRSTPISDMSGVWALASLTTADGTEVLTPPRPDLLEGQLVDSIHLAMEADSGPETGYALFPNLRVQQPGRYRIRISLIDMDSNGSSLGMTSQGGMNLQVVNSSVFTVHPTAPPFRPSKDNAFVPPTCPLLTCCRFRRETAPTSAEEPGHHSPGLLT